MASVRSALFCAVLVGACASKPAEEAPAPAPDHVTVDADDRFCDPVDEMDDDEGSPEAPPAKPLTQWVKPTIGTGGVAWGTGSTYPGPQVPFGMAKPGPDTSHNGGAIEFSHCAGYAREDETIEAFSHTRLHGAGIADYGGIALMPATAFDATKAKPRSHGSRFSHDRETAAPGYYSVTLDDSGVLVELTATARVAVHRYTYPEGAGKVVYLDAGHILSDGTKMRDAEITVDAAKGEAFGSSSIDGSYSARGGGIQIFFVVKFDDLVTEAGTYVGGAVGTATSAHGPDAGAYVRLEPTSGRTIVAHVGLSYVDLEHARLNLAAESKSFDDTRAAAEAAWEQRLSAMTIHARSDRDRTIAYTALYHAGMMPTLASDVDGAYRGIDGQVHQAEGFRYFTDFSLWDTYRTFHPLITLLYPNDARDFAISLTRMGQESGTVPRWPVGTVESEGMIGDGGAIVLADTWMRGVRDWDAAAAYTILKRQATTSKTPGQRGGREGLADYVSLGFVPKDAEGSSAAKTMEYAHADHALGEFAAALGETADADLFHGRGKSWGNVYDEKQHIFTGRKRDGGFDEVDATSVSEDFAEGTAWHYNFMVPHDAEGLATRMGKPMLVARAEQLFTRAACGEQRSRFFPSPYYWPSNEPVLFSAFVFSAVGDQERTARWSRWTVMKHFGDGPDGIPGNDDGGTMSAFYLFAAMGLYPIAGTDRFVLGSPLFPKTVLALPGGNLTIEAPGASRKRRFPREVLVNGAKSSTIVTHGQLANSTLRFTLEREPSDAAKMPTAP